MRCPVCKAENDNGTTCRRCKADLAPLVALEQARNHALTEAARAAATGDGTRALEQARSAHQLRVDHESWRALAVGYLLVRDFQKAIECREHIK